MAKRITSIATVTCTATADTTNLVDATYPFVVQGGGATQRTNILEIYLGGQATASSPSYMLLARDTTFAATAGTFTAGTDAPMDAATAALAAPVLTGNAWTTKPQRSATAHLLNLSFNAFGGIVRWVAAPGEEISIIGAVSQAPLSEVSLSPFTGSTSALLGAHVIYETL